MLRNYLTIAIRNLRRNAGYTAINLIGLAVGMAACLLIGLFIYDELSYDRFHEEADRILALTTTQFGETQRNVPPAASEVLIRDVPGVQHVTATAPRPSEEMVRRGRGANQIERPLRVLRADSSFFEVFSGFEMERGRPGTALRSPDEAIITTSVAQDFFGDKDPIGEVLSVASASLDTTRQYAVAGVTSVPSNSTIQFDVVLPPTSTEKEQGWSSLRTHVYAQVGPGVTPKDLGQAAFQAMPEAARRDEGITEFSALPLPEMYLSHLYQAEGFKGQPRLLYLFGAVALLILLIALVNYVNLVTVQAQRRAREVGVRKAIGARRTQIAGQFLIETFLLTAGALALALGIVSIALPAFSELFHKSISLEVARHRWALVGGAGFVLASSLLAGAYPALVLSGYKPTRILRGASGTSAGSGGWLRKGLVVFQFAASAGLILGTTIIYQQLGYLQTKNLGLDAERVVMIDPGQLVERSGKSISQIETERKSLEQVIRRRALRHPEVQEASITGTVPGRFRGLASMRAPEDLSPAAQTQKKEIEIAVAEVDTNYLETLGLDLLAGRGFTEAEAGLRARGYLLNEAAAEAMGWSVEEAVGKPFSFGYGSGDPAGEVIGVLKNFHVESLHEEIVPVALTLEIEGFYPTADGLTARLAPGSFQEGISHLREAVSTAAPAAEFSYTFLDDRFDQMYRSERRYGRIVSAFAFIAILIACLGLFGLAAYAIRRRTREIGIRKALGASAERIAGLLLKEHVLLVAVALLAGLPIGYALAERWLRDFAYRVDIGPGAFVLTATLVFGIAGVSIGYHALRSAHIDPATAIRQE